MTTATGELRSIAISELEVSSLNPRKDMGDLTELAASIRAQGIIEPLIAIQENGHYSVVAGSRRLAAARKAGLDRVPVVVRELSAEEAVAIALVENLQRGDLAPLEEAEAYRRWLELTGRTQEDLAKAVGRARPTISNALRLLEAPAIVKEKLAKGEITAAHARTMLELKDPALASKIDFDEDMTVDELKAEVDALNREAVLSGAPAISTVKAFHEKAVREHPKATITWKPRESFKYARRVVDLVKALGKPPAAVLGPVGKGLYVGMGTAPTPERHDKLCACRAYEIDAREDYQHGDRLILELKRVCIDKQGWTKARPKAKKPARSKVTGLAKKPAEPKPLTPAQIAKQEAARRKKAEQGATRLLVARKASNARNAPLYARLAKQQIPADVARAIVFTTTLSNDASWNTVPEATPVAWSRLVAMPAKKVSALAAAALAHDIEERDLFGIRADDEDANVAFAKHFGIKVDEPKKPKAKKKARR